jgi:ABC-type lipoprotein export system ATPase subunit
MRSSFGTTVVMVTHDPRAEAYVDDVHTLDKGVLLAGPKPDLAAVRT